MKMKPTAELAPPPRLAREQLRARNVDDVDATGHDQQVLLIRCV
jgi:hypothetical protein